MNIDEIKDELEKLLKEIGEEVKKGYNFDNKSISEKSSEIDLLTKYDLYSSEKINSFLGDKYPEISILDEEKGFVNKNSEYTFVIDPIDGTRNFIKGIPIFYVGIALVKKDETIMCITYNPILEEFFWAIEGKGSFRNGKKIHVSNESELSKSSIQLRILDLQNREKSEKDNLQTYINLKELKTFQIKNDFCSHYEISGVSNGRFEGFIAGGQSAWDMAFYLLVKEAGGKITDFKGEKFKLDFKESNNLVVSNGILHNKLLACILNK